jgi:CheY-like chemotaxis protein
MVRKDSPIVTAKNPNSCASVALGRGEGTTFHLYFPAHGTEALGEATRETAVPKGNGESVLYVDDELPIVTLGKLILERLNYLVEANTDVTKALELLRADPKRFDLVIVDQTMPVMTGIDFAREVAQIRPGLPVILSTGFVGQMNIEQLRAVGIREILPKPPTIQSIGMIVHGVLADVSAN